MLNMMSHEILKRHYCIIKHSKFVGWVLNESMSMGNKTTKDDAKLLLILVKKEIPNKN